VRRELPRRGCAGALRRPRAPRRGAPHPGDASRRLPRVPRAVVALQSESLLLADVLRAQAPRGAPRRASPRPSRASRGACRSRSPPRRSSPRCSAR
jgi:hypothetical protein